MIKKKSKKVNGYFMLVIILSFFILQINCNKPGNSVKTNPETVYYLVAERIPFHLDSYILPLSNPKDIAIADNIINGTAPMQIVVTNIDYGSEEGQYINRDLLNPSKRKWSWHVTNFIGFADAVVRNLDGWPTYVEDHLNRWMRNTEGRIGFATYTIIRRVNPSEME